jgi:hypothetical protein
MDGLPGRLKLGSESEYLPFADQTVAPRAHELAVALKLHDGVRPAVEHQNVAVRIDRHAGYLAEIPRPRRADRARRGQGPFLDRTIIQGWGIARLAKGNPCEAGY